MIFISRFEKLKYESGFKNLEIDFKNLNWKLDILNFLDSGPDFLNFLSVIGTRNRTYYTPRNLDESVWGNIMFLEQELAPFLVTIVISIISLKSRLT